MAEIYGNFSEHLGRCIYEGLYVGEDSEIPNTNGMRLRAWYTRISLPSSSTVKELCPGPYTSIEGSLYVGEDSEIPNTNGMRNDVVAALREMKLPVLRWPGGCFADEYHWKDGIPDKRLVSSI